MKLNKDALERVRQIPWLACCGEPMEGQALSGIQQVQSRDEARRWYESAAWEEVTLEARNTLTSFLHKRYVSQYNEWNTLAKEVKAFMDQEVESKIRQASETYQLGPVWLDGVRWDVLNVIMELSYASLRHTPVFFARLLEVYEMGHLPCGWQGEWPEGKLIVY
ncbi:hypothetical protein Q5741_14450 [Paenibacillus sp. JX-17]|uniref:Uncharacterized protein n=1 Tax=Paenibacillus lacisoli TaxID=3064525 RepID=A0ABT9CEB2_9BACL|nr:hypothetical protein [Paenibacillus sp. JX-17]MDO7907607.1 hypothetical protein [Paenibacillus sp. JX-17]